MLDQLRFALMVGLCGLPIAGCGTGERQKDPAANAAAPATQPAQNSQHQVSLSGCLEAGAVGAATYVLRNVRIEPGGASDPHRNTATSGPAGITEGSWVRLTAAQNLREQIGRRVAVSGVVADSGENTIGTAGASGHVLPSGQRSEAAADEHHSTKIKKEVGRIGRESLANGTAAEITVTQVKDLGEACHDAGIRR